jgi:hypothetical protein
MNSPHSFQISVTLLLQIFLNDALDISHPQIFEEV